MNQSEFYDWLIYEIHLLNEIILVSMVLLFVAFIFAIVISLRVIYRSR